jgi:hypothetical protein
MKRIALLLAVFTAITMTSCRKKYTCNCTDGTPYNIVFTEEIQASSADDAQVKCQLRGTECTIQ